MSNALWNIDKDLELLIEQGFDEETVDPETGEIMGVEERLNALEMSREEKIDNVASYIKRKVYQAKIIRDEEKSFAERRKGHEKNAERLTKYLSDSLQKFGDMVFESARNRITFRKSSGVEIDKDANIPMEYCREVIKYEPDKDKLKAAIESGAEIPGVTVYKDRQNIQIK